ncbi:type II secretion system F family protein [Actinomadura flavalba]|uniref:type II secretion system F family protein n=1 Tax=Actinomadura flavalba TaxID=1120938 RepID=UPI00035EBC12|nr:type II secretion system F family protein [Actinomadura flavalba]
MLPILFMGAGAALCVLAGVWGVALLTGGDRVAAEAVLAPPAKTRDERFLLDRVADVAGRPFTGPVMDLIGGRRATIRRRIDAAGRPDGLTVEGYARRTAGYAVIFALVGLLVILNGHPLLGVLCFVGCFQFELMLFGKRVSRQDDIQRSMPDFLDVLAVTVSAGLSFRMALARVAESMPGALSEEFLVALRQMELGTPRREAFDELRERNNSEAVNQFVTALLQAEELGAPLGTALVDISDDMRRESAQWAKRKAQRANPKITAITMAMTLPALMLVVLGALYFGSGVSSSGLLG